MAFQRLHILFACCDSRRLRSIRISLDWHKEQATAYSIYSTDQPRTPAGLAWKTTFPVHCIGRCGYCYAGSKSDRVRGAPIASIRQDVCPCCRSLPLNLEGESNSATEGVQTVPIRRPNVRTIRLRCGKFSIPLRWAWRERIRTLLAGLSEDDQRFVDATPFDRNPDSSKNGGVA